MRLTSLPSSTKTPPESLTFDGRPTFRLVGDAPIDGCFRGLPLGRFGPIMASFPFLTWE